MPPKKTIRYFLLCSAALASMAAAAADPIALWPNGAPGGNYLSIPEKDGSSAGKILSVTSVSVPTITLFQPPDKIQTGAAVLVCPGGGYNHLAYDKEGTQVCQWLNSIGVAGVLLKYRVPPPPGAPRYAPALQDAQRALGLVRSHAAEWKIDPARIGIIGFSAGGHLAATMGSKFPARTYPAVDASDSVSCRPDFTMLVYPAYLVKEGADWRDVAPEVTVANNTPPTFLVQTEDDRIRVECSVIYYLALKNCGVPAEMHLYASGGHGYGLHPGVNGLGDWPVRAKEWLQTMKIIPKEDTASHTP